MIVRVRGTGNEVRSALRHRRLSGRCGAAKTATEPRKHATKLTFDARVFAYRQRLGLSTLDSLRQGTSPPSPPVGFRTAKRENGLVVHFLSHPPLVVMRPAVIATPAGRQRARELLCLQPLVRMWIRSRWCMVLLDNAMMQVIHTAPPYHVLRSVVTVGRGTLRCGRVACITPI